MIDRDSQSIASIEEFLGSKAAKGGPFALLGLRYQPISRSVILEACAYRLDQISKHPRSHSADADEVRLAIHAAGSQLLDPGHRSELMKHWPEGDGDTISDQKAPQAWVPNASQELSPKIRDQAMVMLGASGGWNMRSRNRLGHFARMNQISAVQLVAALTVKQTSDGGDGDDLAKHHDEPAQSNDVRGKNPINIARLNRGSMPWALIPLSYLAMLLSLVSAAYMSYNPPASQELEVSETVQTLRSQEGNTRDLGQNESLNQARRHYSSIVFELQSLERSGIQNQQQAEQFNKLGERISQQWTEFSGEDLYLSLSSIVAVFHSLINPDFYNESLGFLAVDNGELDEPVVLEVIRTILFGSSDIPSYSEFVLQNHEGFVPEQTIPFFESAFSSRVRGGIDDPMWWEWWIGQVDGFRAVTGESASAEIVILSTLYFNMTEPIGSGDWSGVSQRAAQALQWGEGDPARMWFMGLLTDSKVRSDRLSVLTRAIVTYSSAKGMGVDMILDSDASMLVREEYLRTVRDRWLPRDRDSDDIRTMLLARLDFLIQTTQNSDTSAGTLRKALEIAFVNTACFARKHNDENLLTEALDYVNRVIEVETVQTTQLTVVSSQEDELWASAARNAQTSEEVSNLLLQLQRSDSIGPKSAHSLVYLVMHGPDLQARGQAENVLLSNKESPAVLIALDRVSGYQRSSQRLQNIIFEYLDLSVEETPDGLIRSELFKKMIQFNMVRSSRQDLSGVDSLHQQYLNTLSSRAGGNGSSIAGPNLFYELLLSEYIGIKRSLPQGVINRLHLRLGDAAGPLQEFHAYQVAALELFGLISISNNPELKEQIQSVIERGSFRLSNSQSVYQQILECERSMGMILRRLLENEGV